MDVSKYNLDDMESLTYKQLQKLYKENGLKGKRKVYLLKYLIYL